jgi:threonine dehydratase
VIPLDEIRRARERLGDAVLRTPLVRLDDRIWLKLENLQPIGSFKLRGALSAIRAASAAELAGGVVTASAGNMGQGVAWAARQLGLRATIVAPDTAPRAKLDAIELLDGEIVSVPYEVWWQTMVDRRYDGLDGLFVHPVEDDAVMAGNGTIGLELCEDLAAFDTVVVPWGGGGLTTGIASAVKALRPDVRIVTAEPPVGRRRSTFGPRSSTAPAGRRCCRRCGTARGGSSTRPLRCRSARSSRRSGCSPCARVSSRKEPVRSRSRPRAGARERSSAS